MKNTLFLVSLAFSLALSQISYEGGLDQSNTVGNFSSGFPTAGAGAALVITNTGNFTVYTNGAVAGGYASLFIGNTNGATPTLIVDTPLVITGTLTVESGVTIVVLQGASLSVGSLQIDGVTEFDVSGTVNISQTLSLNPPSFGLTSAFFNVASGGVVYLTNTNVNVEGQLNFNGAGTVNAVSPTFTAGAFPLGGISYSLVFNTAVALSGQVTANVVGFSVTFNNTVSAAAGTVVNAISPTALVFGTGAAVSGSISYVITGLNIALGNLLNATTIAANTIYQNAVTISGNVQATASVTFAKGVTISQGVFSATSGAVVTLNNTSTNTVAATGSLLVSNLNLAAGATLAVAAGANVTIGQGITNLAAGASFTGAGVVNFISETINVQGAVSGTKANLQASTISLANGAAFTLTQLNTSGNSAITFAATNANMTRVNLRSAVVYVSGQLAITGQGLVDFSAATINLAQSSSLTANLASTFQIDGTTSTNSTADSFFNIGGTLAVTASANLGGNFVFSNGALIGGNGGSVATFANAVQFVGATSAVRITNSVIVAAVNASVTGALNFDQNGALRIQAFFLMSANSIINAAQGTTGLVLSQGAAVYANGSATIHIVDGFVVSLNNSFYAAAGATLNFNSNVTISATGSNYAVFNGQFTAQGYFNASNAANIALVGTSTVFQAVTVNIASAAALIIYASNATSSRLAATGSAAFGGAVDIILCSNTSAILVATYANKSSNFTSLNVNIVSNCDTAPATTNTNGAQGYSLSYSGSQAIATNNNSTSVTTGSASSSGASTGVSSSTTNQDSDSAGYKNFIAPALVFAAALLL